MSVGPIGLLDDIAGIARVAAASLDDVAGMAMKAGLKASGAVIDDAAVTPKHLTSVPVVGYLVSPAWTALKKILPGAKPLRA